MSSGTVRKVLLSLIALLLSAAGAKPLRAQDTPTSAGVYSARGTVINSLTGQGVPHALVTLNSEFAALTGGDGQFSIDNVPPGTYMASVSKPGYLGFGNVANRTFGRAMHGPSAPPLAVQVGPDMASVTWRIAPAATIVGQISLSTADPADDIRITLYRRGMHFGHAEWEQAGSARSRSDGSFRIGGLQPGSYMVATEASLDNPGDGGADQGPIWGYPPEYYPGVTDPGAAGVVSLGAGQQGEADIALTRQQFFPVTTTIRTQESRMPGDFEVLDMGGHPTGLNGRFDFRLGIMRANLPNGSWVVEGRGFGREMTWGRVEVHVAGAPLAAALNMQSVPQIPISIQREFTSSTPTSSSGPGVNLVLISADPFAMRSAGGGLGPVPGSNGTAWQVNLAEPGRFWVEVFPSASTYVSSVTSGGVDLASTPLTIDPGSPSPPIDVTLRDDGGSISGQLNSSAGSAPGTTATGEQGGAAIIYAIPQFPFPGQIPQTVARSDGTFSFTNLAPGSWRVVACDAPQEIDYHSPEGLAAWTGKGQTATVEAGGSAHVTVDVTHMENAP